MGGAGGGAAYTPVPGGQRAEAERRRSVLPPSLSFLDAGTRCVFDVDETETSFFGSSQANGARGARPEDGRAALHAGDCRSDSLGSRDRSPGGSEVSVTCSSSRCGWEWGSNCFTGGGGGYERRGGGRVGGIGGAVDEPLAAGEDAEGRRDQGDVALIPLCIESWVYSLFVLRVC